VLAEALAPDAVSSVCKDLRPGGRIVFGDTGICVEVLAKSGRATKLRLTAPRGTHIRQEPEQQGRLAETASME